MQQISLDTAQTQLSRLIADGKAVVIVRCGQPAAKLVPLSAAPKDRVPGSAKGKIKTMDSFLDPLPEM